MKVFILGICGTFMGGLAAIAKQSGLDVVGCDAGIYPPMSDCLAELGISIFEGYDPAQLLAEKPDLVIVGNALSRGNPCVEAMLDNNLAFISGSEWLAKTILATRWTLAVAGTHGKTTTTSILTWLLTAAGLQPGFLIGGRANNFSTTAMLGKSPYFVIEADEYDTAFFDKRPKFIHYHPKTAILNNLEFDHADIYPNLAAIEQQFHYLVRTVPGNGRIILPADSKALRRMLDKGCWSDVETFGVQVGDWQAQSLLADGSQFAIFYKEKKIGEVAWSMFGEHNMQNALAAVAAAAHVGVKPQAAIEYLSDFQGIKRRLEVSGTVSGVTVYDDFAHHPTAIKLTLQALRRRVNKEKIIAVVHFASNSMAEGVHLAEMNHAMTDADHIILATPTGSDWDLTEITSNYSQPIEIETNVDVITKKVASLARDGDHVLVMSNKGFGGIHQKLLDALIKKGEVTHA